MSDGGGSYEDMLQTDGRGFKSSPVDLDGDGQSDVDYPATSQTLVNVLFNMSLHLGADDHLFLYIIDHGGSDTLPNSFQKVFRLSVLEGLSHQEIAALLNIEPHTSSSELFRAKKMLRQSLALLLLGLLCIGLPLGWYWMHVESMDTESNVAQAAGEEGSGDSSTASDVVQSFSDASSEPFGRTVRKLHTINGQCFLTDTLALLTEEHRETERKDSVPEPQQPADIQYDDSLSGTYMVNNKYEVEE